ncbi:peptidase MA family metallohydrolase [Neobacillus sp. C211]|uniref:peptidase MA family metallohydrolase n=1 Tax=unclassified Neobacillus TaxID=2675272 RepID=UPI00397AB810
MKSLYLKKRTKIILIVFSCITILIAGLAFLLFKGIQKELSQKVGEDVKFFEAIKAVTTLNYDGIDEKKLKKDHKTQKIKQITLYYGTNQKDILPLTKETIDRAEKLTKKYLGEYQGRPVDFIFMDSNQLQRFSKLNDISGSYSDFEKVIAVDLEDAEVGNILNKNETSLYLFQKSILHEYTHYATYRVLDEIGTKAKIDDFPVWFIEGIAEYIGENEENLDYHSFGTHFIELTKLNTEKEWQFARSLKSEKGENPYFQGYFTIAFLINTYGDNIISSLLKETSNTQDFYQTLESFTGKDIVELERDIINHYQ